jgi:hypothetical protein
LSGVLANAGDHLGKLSDKSFGDFRIAGGA